MCEAAETCSSCGIAGTVFIIVLLIIIIIGILCCTTDFSDWVEEWLNHWVDKLPRPKDDD